MVRTLSEAQQDLKDLVPTIESAIRAALSRFVTEHAVHRHTYSARTQASIIHDLMALEVRRLLETQTGVACLAVKNSFMINVDQKYLAKFKKMDAHLRTSNIPTQTVLSFMAQEPEQLDLPQVEKETNIIFGYVGRGAELANAEVWVKCPNHDGATWSWKLDEAGAPVVPLRTDDGEREDLYTAKTATPKVRKSDDDGSTE